jgi:hypothetical protein
MLSMTKEQYEIIKQAYDVLVELARPHGDLGEIINEFGEMLNEYEDDEEEKMEEALSAVGEEKKEEVPQLETDDFLNDNKVLLVQISHDQPNYDYMEARNMLSDYLETKGFQCLDSSGSRACFTSQGQIPGNQIYNKFTDCVNRFCSRPRRTIVIDKILHIQDPGLGLVLEGDF